MESLDLCYADFDDFMKRGLSGRMRGDLRRKFRAGSDTLR
jgi:hypothetical protein